VAFPCHLLPRRLLSSVTVHEEWKFMYIWRGLGCPRETARIGYWFHEFAPGICVGRWGYLGMANYHGKLTLLPLHTCKAPSIRSAHGHERGRLLIVTCNEFVAFPQTGRKPSVWHLNAITIISANLLMPLKELSRMAFWFLWAAYKKAEIVAY